MKMEIIQRDPNYGRANLIPMKHPRDAKLDSNPPEHWYVSVRLPVKIGRTTVHCTLPQLSVRENRAMRAEVFDPGCKAHMTANEIRERRRAVLDALTPEWQRTAAVAATIGRDADSVRMDLEALARSGAIRREKVKQGSASVLMWMRP